jgi:hypothetical protein
MRPADWATAWFRRSGGTPCFRVYGKGRREQDWRVVDVFATHRRDVRSLWPAPFWRGTCITWTAAVIAVGWDFALGVLREQATWPASREHPLCVFGGRLRDARRRAAVGITAGPGHGEVLAHEIGHTWQALRFGVFYWPLGASLTLFREGPGRLSWFENQASEEGLFGGIVTGSVSAEVRARQGQTG